MRRYGNEKNNNKTKLFVSIDQPTSTSPQIKKNNKKAKLTSWMKRVNEYCESMGEDERTNKIEREGKKYATLIRS